MSIFALLVLVLVNC